MSEKLTKIDASPEAKGLDRDLRADVPKTIEEFDVLLARYKKQSPEQYEKKLENGTFVKQAKALGFAWGVETPKGEVEIVDKKVVEIPKKEDEKKVKGSSN